MLRFAMIAAVLALVLAACTTIGGDATTTTRAVADDRLVVATSEGSVVVYSDAGTELSRFDPSSTSVFLQPTWLDGSTVVFSKASEPGDHSLIAGDAGTGEVVWRSPMESLPFFFAPAPAGSDYVTTSLRSDPRGGLIAELIDSEGVVTFLGDESPFYTSWSPDGDLIAINNPGDHLDIWEDGEFWTIVEHANGYQTPVWLDQGLVIVRDVGDQRFLSIWDLEGFQDVAVVEGSAAFVGKGHRIAIKTTGSDDEPGGARAALRVQDVPTIPANRLVTIDLDTRDIATVTTEPTAMFQWDPDGERLLFAEASLEVGLRWSVWEDGGSEVLADYRPNPEWIGELIPFFDQYAQSVQFWSPSGDKVAFPALVNLRPVVIVHDVNGGTEITIPDARWVSWATNR